MSGIRVKRLNKLMVVPELSSGEQEACWEHPYKSVNVEVLSYERSWFSPVKILARKTGRQLVG